MIFFTVKLCAYVLFPMRSREQSDDYPMLMSHVTPKTIPLLSFLRSDLLGTEVALYTTNQHVKVEVYLKNLRAEMIHFNDP